MCKLYLFFILVIERVGRYIHTYMDIYSVLGAVSNLW